jgi:predicted metal-dependent hydrolase
MPTIDTPIIRRRVNLDIASARVPGWFAEQPMIEHGLSATSFLFPTGEAFFAESVRYYLDRIDDSVLKAQTRDFIYQEAVHAKEHARANETLKGAYPYGAEIERFNTALMRFLSRWTPHSTQLAVTCALEHFTAMLADEVLSHQDELIPKVDPAMAALMFWHAAEETEHKAVCFDVYQAVVGKGVFAWAHRVTTMAVVSLFSLGAIAVFSALIRRKMRRSESGSGDASWAAHAPRLNLSGLWRSGFKKLYFDYYRPSFHPWGHDNSRLVAKWKLAYANFPGITEASSRGAGAA